MQHNDYQKRIDRVVDYVLRNVGEELTLGRLANVAHFSPYHLHRIFSAMTGESLGRFVQRSRLERGAIALRSSPGLTITDAALACGYESPDGFSRAFRKHYGISPSAWDRTTPLRARDIGPHEEFPTYTPGELLDLADEHGLLVEVIDLPESDVVYVRQQDAYRNPQDVVSKYDRLVSYLQGEGFDPNDTVLYGIQWDDPDVVSVERCTFEWAAAVVVEGVLADWLMRRTVPRMMVARVRLQGGLPLEDIIWQYLYRVWLPESHYVPAAAPAREIYVTPPESGNWQSFDLWCALPVETAAGQQD